MALEFVRVGNISDFEPGVLHPVTVGQRDLAVVRIEDRFYAVENFCTHEAVMFTNGYGVVAASALVCMLHGSVFDLASGEVINGPASDPLSTFEVRVEDSEVFVAQEPASS